MPDIKVLFFDVGGVLLSNGWDRRARRAACEEFGLDWEDFQDRHEFVADAFERGDMDLETYLERTIFHRERPFSQGDFVEFMRARSQPNPESLQVLAELSASGECLLATLNNESRELNEFRIDKYRLQDHFLLFLSSCYLGVRKPEPEIYKMAVDIVQQPAENCALVVVPWDVVDASWMKWASWASVEL